MRKHRECSMTYIHTCLEKKNIERYKRAPCRQVGRWQVRAYTQIHGAYNNIVCFWCGANDYHCCRVQTHIHTYRCARPPRRHAAASVFVDWHSQVRNATRSLRSMMLRPTTRELTSFATYRSRYVPFPFNPHRVIVYTISS